jgi:hypothetical protein
MAIKITDEIIKEYTEREGLPEVYDAYKGIKNSKDLKKFMRDPLNKRTVEAIEIEQKRDKKIEALNKMREDSLYEGATDEELVEVDPETFADIESEKAEVQFGIPANLFPQKGEMSNREWLALTRENFRKAGLDFDNKEDRQRAAEAAAREQTRESLREEAKKEGASGWATPSSQARMEAGEPVRGVDVAADVMRIAEAAPPVVAGPAIVGRNILEGYANDKSPREVAGDIATDMMTYAGGGVAGRGIGQGMRLFRGPLRKFVGGQRMGEKALGELIKGEGKGSRRQVAEATAAALEGKTAGPTNPYAEQAAKVVADADLTTAQKKRALGPLNKYIEGTKNPLSKKYTQTTTGEIEKQAEGAMQTKRLGKDFDKEVRAEAKEIGREMTSSTMGGKLSFDDIAKNLSDDDAANLLKKLESEGLRDENGAKVFFGVQGKEASDAAHAIRESEVVAKWLNQNKTARNMAARSEAEKRVMERYGTQADPKLRGIFRFVADAPVAYEKVTGKGVSPFGGKKAVQSLSRYAGPRITENLGQKDEE